MGKYINFQSPRGRRYIYLDDDNQSNESSDIIHLRYVLRNIQRPRLFYNMSSERLQRAMLVANYIRRRIYSFNSSRQIEGFSNSWPDGSPRFSSMHVKLETSGQITVLPNIKMEKMSLCPFEHQLSSTNFIAVIASPHYESGRDRRYIYASPFVL